MSHLSASLCSRVFKTLPVLMVFLLMNSFARGQVGTVPGFPTQQGDISTIAGNHAQSGSLPSGQSATSANLSSPIGVAIDASGNLYISDPAVFKVYEVNTQGNITVIAGGGEGITSGSDVSATSIQLGSLGGLAVDSSGNLYIADTGESVVRQVNLGTGIITTFAGSFSIGYTGDGGLPTSATLNGPTDVAVDSMGNVYIADNGNNVIRKVNKQTGFITTVAGKTKCTTFGVCGDGGPATAAQLNGPHGIAFDTSDNLYIADATDSRIRVVYAAGNVAGLSNLTQGYIYTVASTGAKLCSASLLPCGDNGLATAAILDTPRFVKVDGAGNVFISDNGNSAIREVNAQTGKISTVVGTLASSGFSGDGDPAAGAKLATPGGLLFDTFGNLYIADTGNFIVRGVTGIGAVPLTAQTITFPAPSNVTYSANPIDLSATASSGLAVTYTVTQGHATVSGSTLTITGAGSVTVQASQAGGTNDGITYGAATSVSQTFTVTPAQVTVSANAVSVAFGTSTTALAALLTYDSFGEVGSDTLTGTPNYTVGPCSDGNPTYTATTVAGTTCTITPSVGSLSIAPKTSASNYSTTFAFQTGTLSVSGGGTETITFPKLTGPYTYGQSPVALTATASSGLPVSYTVSGTAATVTGSSATGYSLTFTGAGTVTVTANQGGNNNYAAATPATQVITVNRATISVTAASLSVPFGTTTASLASQLSATVTGFVGTDSYTGAPALTASGYTATSAPNTIISITPAQGTLAITPATDANNYTISYIPGTLTVTTNTQKITFPPIAFGTYGGTVILSATASSSLPVTYTVTGPAKLTSTTPATLLFTGVGSVTVTATQAGNADYASATATQSFSSVPAVLTITPNPVIIGSGQPIPPFTYTIMGFVAGDGNNASVLTGVPVITTTATSASPAGTYPIVASLGTPCAITDPTCANTPCSTVLSPTTPCTGGLLSTNYTFAFYPGSLTIDGTPSFIATATPTTVSVESGHISQTTIGFTVLNGYQGTVAFSCGQLPVNITCTFSPATVALTLANNGATTAGTISPSAPATVSTTLTINTTGNSPVVGMLRPTGSSTILSASMFFFPAGLTGLFLAYRRKRLTSSAWGKHLFVLMILLAGAAGLTACGGGSMSGNAPVGTTPIIVTATGTGTNGSPNVTSAVTVTLNVTQ